LQAIPQYHNRAFALDVSLTSVPTSLVSFGRMAMAIAKTTPIMAAILIIVRFLKRLAGITASMARVIPIVAPLDCVYKRPPIPTTNGRNIQLFHFLGNGVNVRTQYEMMVSMAHSSPTRFLNQLESPAGA